MKCFIRAIHILCILTWESVLYFWAVLGFEVRGLHLQGRLSTT
jgi:hypothetical protein